MDYLPAEVYDHIVGSLYYPEIERRQKVAEAKRASKKARRDIVPESEPEPEPDLRFAPLATINRRWQASIERHLLRSFALDSSELVRFAQVYSCTSRRHALHRIEYTILLPGYGDDGKKKLFEREPDRLMNNKCFTAAVQDLFRILSRWDECHDGSLSLSIVRVASPDDPAGDDSPDSDVGSSLGQYRYTDSYLQLLRPDDLPIVPVVGIFCAYGARFGDGRKWDYRTTMDIVAKLPKVRMIRQSNAYPETQYPGLRRSQRAELARKIRNVLPSRTCLTIYHLLLGINRVKDHGYGPPNLLPPGMTTDPVSTALFEATSYHESIRELHLDGSFDESLFGPKPLLHKAPLQPYWQHLRRLTVFPDMMRPSGQWYFRNYQGSSGDDGADDPNDKPTELSHAMPPGYSSTEEQDQLASREFDVKRHKAVTGQNYNISRLLPDDRFMIPLFRAFAQACEQIPTLQRSALQFIIHSPIPASSRYLANIWGVYYLAPNAKPLGYNQDPVYQRDVDRRRLFWEVGNWDPGADIKASLRAIGRDQHGGDLLERHANTFETCFLPRHMKW